MDIGSSRLKIPTLTIALGGALVGCEGGAYYDANTGRIVVGAPPARSTAAAASNDRAQPESAQPAPDSAQPSYGSGQSPSSYGQPSYDRGSSASSYAGSSSYAASVSSFDPTSRTPPVPQIQADGTPLKPQLAQVSPRSGPAEGGNEVLITGSGFANAQVMFGGHVARVTSQSSNAITVIAPEGLAGAPVTVVVTNRDGSYAVAGAAYTHG
jgi:hypothetical protein